VISAVMLAPFLLVQAPPVFGVGIEAVSVDVSVTRRGTPVRGLRAEDFVV
jgi:hypothetical protein